jgi:hypothetical protein
MSETFGVIVNKLKKPNRHFMTRSQEKEYFLYAQDKSTAGEFIQIT